MVLKTTLSAAVIAAVIALSPVKAEAIKGELNYTASKVELRNYVKGKFFYTLPGGIKGFTFSDLKKDQYFGKSFFTSPDYHNISAKGQLIHSNEPLSEAGIGLEADIPTPKGLDLKVIAMPLWAGHNGLERKATLGYTFRIGLPYRITAKGCGEWKFQSDSKGQWGYGECDLEKQIGRFVVGYNCALTNKGDATPEVIHRGVVGVRF